jgi:hypothetical protein
MIGMGDGTRCRVVPRVDLVSKGFGQITEFCH